VARLAAQTQMQLRILRADEPSARASVRRLHQGEAEGNPIRIDQVSRGRMRVSSLYRGIDGKAVLMVATQLPRTITLEGASGLWSNLAWTLSSAILILALMMFGLRRAVLAPVAALVRHTREVERTGDLSLRLDAQGGSEIVQLASSFDRMLESLAAARAQLEADARTDGLTGIANRRFFDESLALEWRRMARARRPLSVLLGDVDFFKQFNDSYGHAAGDDCLRAVGRVLEAHARRAGDLVARYGGEEFVVLLPDTTLEGALHVARQICADLAAERIPHASSDAAHIVTMSLGVASFVPTSGDPTMLVEAADAALYAAKRAGRNRAMSALHSAAEVAA